MKRLIKKKGQSTLEYAVVIAVVIAALVYLGWGWFRGAYQKRLMTASDDISGGGQFDIEHTAITSTHNRITNSVDTLQGTATGAHFESSTNEQLFSDRTANTDRLSERQ